MPGPRSGHGGHPALCPPPRIPRVLPGPLRTSRELKPVQGQPGQSPIAPCLPRAHSTHGCEGRAPRDARSTPRQDLCSRFWVWFLEHPWVLWSHCRAVRRGWCGAFRAGLSSGTLGCAPWGPEPCCSGLSSQAATTDLIPPSSLPGSWELPGKAPSPAARGRGAQHFSRSAGPADFHNQCPLSLPLSGGYVGEASPRRAPWRWGAAWPPSCCRF